MVGHLFVCIHFVMKHVFGVNYMYFHFFLMLCLILWTSSHSWSYYTHVYITCSLKHSHVRKKLNSWPLIIIFHLKCLVFLSLPGNSCRQKWWMVCQEREDQSCSMTSLPWSVMNMTELTITKCGQVCHFGCVWSIKMII